MSEFIKDGTGKGYNAKVTSSNQLSVKSVSRTDSQDHARRGSAYNINTGTINLTSDGQSSLLYLTNTGNNELVITGLFYLLGNSTNGSGDILVQVHKNPTTGTLISAGTSFEAQNRNFARPNSLSGTCLRGAEASTVTDGSIAIESIFSSVGRKVLDVGSIYLERSNSIAISVTPPAGNTSMDVQLAIGVYIEDVTE